MSGERTDNEVLTLAPPGSGAELLEVRDLRVRFSRGGRRVHAVNGLSYRLNAGEILAIIGESGSGKSVSARTLMGLLPPSAQVTGSARFAGTELLGLPEREMRGRRGAEIAMVFQDPARSLNPTMRIGAQITEAIRAHSALSRKQAAERAVELLKLVHLPAAERRFYEYPHQLSGGMRQRVVIAIALAGEPRLLIADEATTALDVTTQAQIMELLLELKQRLGMAIILISHDLGLAASYAQNVVVMYAGRAVEYTSAEELFAHVRMPYTQALLGAIPLLEREPHALLPVIPGQPPDPAALPPGCPFRPRCAAATDACAEPPPFVEHEPGHWWACWHPAEDLSPQVKDGVQG
ncbi:ABC transporter ATP-binding protein [Nonomuraea sp. NPDC049714]|uniref:ABC transporter ATP-binding protein n=1 Tax=Nonomuraea sp. NPDC049714 TaxID=3364357 RepID=UPI0037BD7B9B